jgi:hypothetical protein
MSSCCYAGCSCFHIHFPAASSFTGRPSKSLPPPPPPHLHTPALYHLRYCIISSLLKIMCRCPVDALRPVLVHHHARARCQVAARLCTCSPRDQAEYALAVFSPVAARALCARRSYQTLCFYDASLISNRANSFLRRRGFRMFRRRWRASAPQPRLSWTHES